MRKEGLYHRNNNDEPQFSDADYSIDIRVDPLTTRDNIKAELRQIEKNQQQRKIDAENKAQAEQMIKDQAEPAKAQDDKYSSAGDNI